MGNKENIEQEYKNVDELFLLREQYNSQESNSKNYLQEGGKEDYSEEDLSNLGGLGMPSPIGILFGEEE